MRYVVTRNVVQVIGTIWMPMGPTFAQDYDLSSYDLENARDGDGNLTRESVQGWLDTHAGDFSHVADFSADLEDGSTHVEIPWSSEDSGMAYWECMDPGDGS